jgi:hypothetical protein
MPEALVEDLPILRMKTTWPVQRSPGLEQSVGMYLPLNRTLGKYEDGMDLGMVMYTARLIEWGGMALL